MSTTIVSSDHDSVVSEIDIAAPPDRVFRALTDASQLRQWFGGSRECPEKSWKMDARAGGRYSYATQPGGVEVNGVRAFACEGEILEYVPPHLLIYTWIANWHDTPGRSTVVRWDLFPTATGTHVKVTHSGLASLPVARKDYSGGWPGVVANLKKFAEGGL